jgi:hypothetical protein
MTLLARAINNVVDGEDREQILEEVRLKNPELAASLRSELRKSGAVRTIAEVYSHEAEGLPKDRDGLRDELYGEMSECCSHMIFVFADGSAFSTENDENGDVTFTSDRERTERELLVEYAEQHYALEKEFLKEEEKRSDKVATAVLS